MAIRDRFDLVILDWAGTVVDFGCHAPVIALREAFARHGVSLSEAQVRRDMGKAKQDHVRALLRDPTVAAAWRAAKGASTGEVAAGDPAAGDPAAGAPATGAPATGAPVGEAAAVAALMSELEPLMRDQAGRAARLIDGARTSIEQLRAAGVKIASSTGYTRDMMQPVLAEAAAQGYVPDHLVCSGETPAGRPTPLMIYKACAELGVWPLSRVVKVDDTEAGVAEGRAAGCFTIGVSASGNGLGLTRDAWLALPAVERASRLHVVEKSLLAAGADIVIETIADLLTALEQA